MSPNNKGMLLWWICSTICDYVSRIEWLCTTMDKHNCVLSMDIVPVVMEIIQLDNNDGACDLISLCGYNDAKKDKVSFRNLFRDSTLDIH
jgi:hypothetical protein